MPRPFTLLDEPAVKHDAPPPKGLNTKPVKAYPPQAKNESYRTTMVKNGEEVEIGYRIEKNTGTPLPTGSYRATTR